ncbi:hypothetical protein Glove_134g265 [Diversispora epigaea]|uniref:Uncharacterized protein n=1 Tax=Diversispora epigaea TaxID=1348612 RepID=A0A397J6X0_9GLOM|nr:hypothetical protein Glove_134g265 [Diversispora epigaea]
MINSLESKNLLNNEYNFESIYENSNEDEDDKNENEGENEDKDKEDEKNLYNVEIEEKSLISNISNFSVLFFKNMKLSNSDENYSFNNYAPNNNKKQNLSSFLIMHTLT